MRLVSVYTPAVNIRPCVIISTDVHYLEEHNKEKNFDVCETVIFFTHEAYTTEDGYSYINRIKDEDWIIMKKHKSKRLALKYHNKLAYKLCRGYRDHFDFYFNLLMEYCPSNKFKSHPSHDLQKQ